MKNKSKKAIKIIIIIITILVILCIAIAGTLYLLKGNLKSKREIYTNNLMQFMRQEITTQRNLSTYLEKKKLSQYKNKGQFYIKIEDSSQENKEEIENANLTKIKFEGKTDPLKNQAEQNIKIEYPQNITFPINYKRNKDLYGLQTNYISSKYITIENNNLEEFTEKLGYTDSTIPDKIEIPTQEIKEQILKEKEKIQEKYSEILNKIPEDNITITNNEKGKEYNLKITQNIVTQILEEIEKSINETYDDETSENDIENEESITDKISNVIKENIIISIEEEEENEAQETNLTITTENDKPIKLELKTKENSINVLKTEQEDKCKYTINILNKEGDSTTNIEIELEIDGISTQETVNENYKLSMENINEEETYKFEYCYENEITFTNNIQVEELTKEDSMILNEYEPEQIESFLEAVQNRIEQVNKEQMEELGVKESENPLMYYIDPLGIQRNVLNRAKEAKIRSDIANIKEEIMLIANEVSTEYNEEENFSEDAPTETLLERISNAIEEEEYSGATVTVEDGIITIMLNIDGAETIKGQIDPETGIIGNWTDNTEDE